jgi:hypothetical protein
MKILIRSLGVLALLGLVFGIAWYAAGPSETKRADRREAEAKGRSTAPDLNLPALPGQSAPIAGMAPGQPLPTPLDPLKVGGMDPEVFQERLHDILVNDAIEHDTAAQMLLQMLPACNVEQQVELSEHAANLLDDSQYGQIRDLLLNPGIHQDVKEVWFSDMLNRDQIINVPLLADIARQKDNPFAEEALDTLSIILDPEIAENPRLIEGAVKKYLDELKAEEAAFAGEDPAANQPPGASAAGALPGAAR